MQSPEIVMAALATILVGAAALRYQVTGKRRFEMALIVFGVASVASGFAMFRDGLEGTREFLWMMPSKPAVVGAEGATPPLDRVPLPRTASVLD